jgi:hypothetical protein
MKKIIMPAIVFFLKKMDLYALFCLKREGHLKNSGWFNSFRLGVPIDGKDDPIPWMTYSSIAFIERKVHSGMTVFEYSCGNSTLWWSKRVNKLVSCEHDKGWFERMQMLILPNVDLIYRELEYGGAYSRTITEYQREFDIIVIDGRDRINCAKNCLGALKDDGVIIWDNSDRTDYQEGYSFLIDSGFKRLDFEGMGPVNVYAWCTSIFYRNDNCLGL